MNVLKQCVYNNNNLLIYSDGDYVYFEVNGFITDKIPVSMTVDSFGKPVAFRLVASSSDGTTFIAIANLQQDGYPTINIYDCVGII